MERQKDEGEKGYGAIVAVRLGLRRIAGAGHSRRRRSENSGRSKTWARGGRRGQEARPFLQMEKYYGYYRSATKVWPSRSFSLVPECTMGVKAPAANRVFFYQTILFACRILVTITVRHPVKITRS